jgi:hypothetical protein
MVDKIDSKLMVDHTDRWAALHINNKKYVRTILKSFVHLNDFSSVVHGFVVFGVSLFRGLTNIIACPSDFLSFLFSYLYGSCLFPFWLLWMFADVRLFQPGIATFVRESHSFRPNSSYSRDTLGREEVVR